MAERPFIFLSEKKSKSPTAVYHGCSFQGRGYHEAHYSATNTSSPNMIFRCENRGKMNCVGGLIVSREGLNVISKSHSESEAMDAFTSCI